ncbi:MAG TPA: response regulator transcription factor [Gaiellaceae bacterium]|nr:response regulator transcription factor [Gaiellaceae bacterium]
MSERTTVLLADDHPGILAAVSKYLDRNGLDVVASAQDGYEALRLIEEKQPDIALLDVRMPGASGIEVTRLAARRAPETAVILFSGYGSRGQVAEALDAGARGFLIKNVALAEVLRAVQVVSRGGTYIDATLAAGFAVPEDGPTLTRRQRNVLRLLASGERYEEIGRDLFVSTATVRKIMFNVKSELGAATATEAVAAALRHSLIA